MYRAPARVLSLSLSLSLSLVLLLALVAASCARELPTTPNVAHANQYTIQCWMGYCGEDPDPNPDSVGVYVSQYVTDESCLDTESSDDLDQDGITDYCELRLAQAFAPQLKFNHNDDLGQEPAFAVKSLGYHNGRYMALVMYMLSEYIDAGTDYCGSGGAWLVGQTLEVCGHQGDSEAIVLRLRYEASTAHWVTDAAWYSQHEGYGVYCNGLSSPPHAYSSGQFMEENDSVYSHAGLGECDYGSGDLYPPTLSYTANPGSAPIAHVSISKHANYDTEAHCNGGNPRPGSLVTFWADACYGDTTLVVNVPGTSRNVGSSDHHEYFLDCTESGNPALYQFHYVECYWSGNSYGGFSGWSGASPMSSSYADRLNGWVFGPW